MVKIIISVPCQVDGELRQPETRLEVSEEQAMQLIRFGLAVPDHESMPLTEERKPKRKTEEKEKEA